ncbi:MAG: hypothetical protein KatS3mg048_3420 [Caldilinea sp.]|nr:MAG: hypothetical protein KatS3mg048_3420 [Caldilinea sp.]
MLSRVLRYILLFQTICAWFLRFSPTSDEQPQLTRICKFATRSLSLAISTNTEASPTPWLPM